MWQWLTKWRTRRRERGKGAGSLEQWRPPSRWQRLARVGIAFAAAVGVCGFLDLHGFHYLEKYAYGARLKVYAARNGDLAEEAKKQIVLVTFNEDTLTELGLPDGPLPRNYHAQVLRELTGLHAKVIAFDVVFAGDRPEDPEFAAAAQESARKGTVVVWACELEGESPHQELLLPSQPLRQASPRWGHTLVGEDREHPGIDRVEAIILHHRKRLFALSLKTVMMALGLQEPPRRTAEGWQVEYLTIPVNEEGCFYITYLEAPFEPIPYQVIYSGAANEGPSAEIYREVFRDKIVLIGSMVNNVDYQYTPVGYMWGVEIHAHAIATLLQRGFVRKADPWINAAVLCLLVALVCPLVAACRLSCAALGALGLLIGYLVVNFWLFADYGVWLHLVAPSAAILLTALGGLLERSLTVEREKNRMRGLLRRYLSPQTAEYVLANPDKCHLGGERVTATVLFSDIRGFTAVSEKLAPEEVVARINEYLQAMTQRVFKVDGAVDKYVGDCIMALFGIPVPHPDHPHRAVAAAIDMQSALWELQAHWRAQGLPVLDIGIGIHTGEMVVGNFGMEDRWDFTVIGDAVNLASRVESLNKDLETRILITAATYEFVRDEVDVRGPRTAHVKGKEEEVIVYEVFGWREAQADGGGPRNPAAET